jgi:DNA-binding MarR family transcriptional regulator
MFIASPKDSWGRSRRELKRTALEVEIDEALEAWRAFMHARRALDRSLKEHGISFAQWRVLYATDRLVREYEDVVGQMEIARELEVSEATMSELLGRLARAGLVNIEPECWRTLNGVLLAPRGEALLEETREAVRVGLRELLDGRA